MSNYEIKLARQSGGKAGKGHNKTSTVQVHCDSIIVKQFRFNVDEAGSFKKALAKAQEYTQREASK